MPNNEMILGKSKEGFELAGEMVIRGISCTSIEFFFKTLDYVYDKQNKDFSCTELGKQYGCTPQMAARHVKELTKSEYYHRVNYRSWKISPPIQLKFLRKVENAQTILL